MSVLLDLSSWRARYSALDNEHLQLACRAALSGKLETITSIPSRRSGAIIRSLLRHLGFDALDEDADSLVALGAEAFARAPADLPPGSRLYLEQIQAASALSTRTLVEMDTGEGKTYAILPAAFALACRYQRVYVVCASEYLAWRDAERTHPFWTFVGLEVGLAVPGNLPQEWGARVVYTTLKDLLFKDLIDSIKDSRPTFEITPTALILDEVDAILLDQGATPYSVFWPVATTAHDWSLVLELASDLTQGRDLIVDRFKRTAALTREGEAAVAKAIEARGLPGTPPTLLLRYGVEVAWVASQLVKEGVDYVVQGQRAYGIDPVSGRVDANATPYWIHALEHLRGLAPRPRAFTLNDGNPLSFFDRFSHVSGTSGTVTESGMELLLNYQLWYMQISPRFPRSKGVEVDQVFRSAREAKEAAVERVQEQLARSRPVLIGTQTIAEAEELHDRLLELGISAVKVTGNNESGAHEVFSSAGQVGSVVVATQLAGRGVDIRLSPEAKAHGGLDLICVGHAVQERHDRQFLGRVGRHGDPFSAVFFCSLEDELLQLFSATKGVANLMTRLGMEDGEAVTNPMVHKSIRRAQREAAVRRFIDRRAYILLAESELTTSRAAISWFEQLQLPSDPHGALAPDFLAFVCKRFVSHYAQPMLGQLRLLDRQSSERLLHLLASALEMATDKLPFTTLDIEGMHPAEAANFLERRLNTALTHAAHRGSCRATLFAYAAELSDSLPRLLATARQLELEKPPTEPARELPPPGSEDVGGAVEAGKEESQEEKDVLEYELARSTLGELAPRLAFVSWREQVEELQRQSAQVRARLEEHIEFAKRGGVEPEGPLAVLSWSDQLLSRAEARLDAALSTESDSEGGSPRSSFDELIAEVSSFTTDLKPCWTWSQRSPRRIAYWAIQWAWSEFLEERKRIQHRVGQLGLVVNDYYRTVGERILDRWEKIEDELPARLIRVLLSAERAEHLDNLFYLEDHRASDMTSIRPEYRRQVGQAPSATPQELSLKAIVDEFLLAFDAGRLEAGARSQLVRLTVDFLTDHALHELQTPVQVLKALDRWSQTEIERAVDPDRQRQRRDWLQQLLVHLHRRRLIGPLPNLRDRLMALGVTMWIRFRGLRTAVPVLVATVFVPTFLVLAHWAIVAEARALPPLWAYLDKWAAGGLLAAGSLLGPACGSLVAVTAMRWLLSGSNPARAVGLTGLDRILLLLSSIGLALWLVAGATLGPSGPLGLAIDCLWFALALGAGAVAHRAVLLLAVEVPLDLVAAWLSYSSLLVVIPLAAGPGLASKSVIVAVAAAGLLYTGALWSRQRVPLVSARVGSAGDPSSGEEITTWVEIPGQASYFGPVLGLLLAWTVAGILERPGLTLDPAISHIVLLTVFLAGDCGWIALVLRRRFGFQTWLARLNSHNQRIHGVATSVELAEMLGKMRTNLVLRQIVVVVVVSGGLTFLLWPTSAALTTLPLSLILFTAAAISAQEGAAFLAQARNLFSGHTGQAVESFDLAALPEPEKPKTIWQMLRSAMRRRTALMLTTLVLLFKGAQALEALLQMIGWID